MEKIDKVIYTAIIGPYEELKEPTYYTPGWKYVCFTDQDLKSKTWEIRRVSNKDLSPQRLARDIKINFYEFIEEQWSIWIDGSFTINCNLNQFCLDNIQNEFNCSPHPIRKDVFDEARTCVRNKRGDAEEIKAHIKKYVGVVPRNNGLITSGLLIRQLTENNISLAKEWWKELSENSTRDQISFAKVSMGKDFIHNFAWDYRTAKDFEFKTHFNRR